MAAPIFTIEQHLAFDNASAIFTGLLSAQLAADGCSSVA
jgi:hypothetical protein